MHPRTILLSLVPLGLLGSVAVAPVAAEEHWQPKAEAPQVAQLGIRRLLRGGDGGRERAAPGGLEEHELKVGNLERSFLLYVPPSYNAQKPAPLVFVIHGGGGNADAFAETTKMHTIAAQEGFIVVYPQGTGRSDRSGTWNAGGNPPEGYAEQNRIDDLGFIRALLATLRSNYNIDAKRIFATGMSKGGVFSYYLACRMPDEFAAIAPVAATLADAGCRPPPSVSLFHIHGTKDENIPLNGGHGRMTGGDTQWPSPLKSIEFWRNADNCSNDKTQAYDGQDTDCWEFRGCQSGTAVAYCLVQDGGHAWPGATPANWQRRYDVKVTQNFSASAEIWGFFEQHPKASGR